MKRSKAQTAQNWPLVAGCTFFLFYQYAMHLLLYSERTLPPVNDSFFYVFRIDTVLNGRFVNDTSILFTYFAAFISWVANISPFKSFHWIGFAGPAVVAAVLYRLFVKLRFSPLVSGLCFFFLAFYCNIGPHTFLHFVPSTLAVVLSLLWLSFAVDDKTRFPLLTGFVICAAQILSHSSGVFLVVLNNALLIALFWRRKGDPFWRFCLGGVAAVAFCVPLLKLLPFKPLFPIIDMQEWLNPAEISRYQDSGGMGGYSYDPGGLVLNESQLAGRTLWFARLYANFFIFLFPKWYLVFVVLPALLLLGFHSWRKKSSAIHNRALMLYTAVYFLMFLSMSYWHQRGTRMIEYAFPMLFICYAILVSDVSLVWLRRTIVGATAIYLGFLSYNFTTTENLFFKRLAVIPPAMKAQIFETPVFYVGSQVASFLLANGLIRVEQVYRLPFFKELDGKYYFLTFTPCPTEQPTNPVRRLFRKISPLRPTEPPDDPLKLDYATATSARYELVVEDLNACLKLFKIRFPSKARKG